jgi:hypothetical protein
VTDLLVQIKQTLYRSIQNKKLCPNQLPKHVENKFQESCGGNSSSSSIAGDANPVVDLEYDGILSAHVPFDSPSKTLSKMIFKPNQHFK